MKITELEVQDLKAKYGDNLELITIDMENGKEAEYVIRTPPRSVIEAVSDNDFKEGSNAEAAKILLANCVIHGDTNLIERDGRVYMTLINAIRNKIRNYKFEVKKF